MRKIDLSSLPRDQLERLALHMFDLADVLMGIQEGLAAKIVEQVPDFPEKLLAEYAEIAGGAVDASNAEVARIVDGEPATAGARH